MANKEDIAKILLENKAVTLNPKDPFTYTSGIRSPIYCDNRILIGILEEREKIVDSYLEVLKGVDFDVVAGTSTAGIPWAAWISERLNKPMCYIRSDKKGHGTGKQIEGASVEGKKIVIIEDLISTGKSSFGAVEAARNAKAQVLSVLAIFTYELEKSRKIFEEGNCKIITLTDFSTLVRTAKEISYISEEELKIVLVWNQNPEEWETK
ncbi:orotate phosphoribosyltransferase [Candidatus Woesearchaeota archaeon]|nr:orotate phosphoribosyltransferase [Candidatus Woesearchaeota archaeon]